MAEQAGAAVLVLSEYGITASTAPCCRTGRCARPACSRLREELGRELLDAGASRAFAVCDHQIAHVYVRDAGDIAPVKALLEASAGIETVLDAEGKRAAALDHPRAGELVAISRADRWFAYPWWLDDAKAPDFARTVDIHRKPGYDPVELFLDPSLRAPKLAVGWRLAKKALGFRTLMDVIPLDPSLVRGSHGRPTDDPARRPAGHLVGAGAAGAGSGGGRHGSGDRREGSHPRPPFRLNGQLTWRGRTAAIAGSAGTTPRRRGQRRLGLGRR